MGWFRIVVLLFSHCVIVDKLFNVSEPQFCHLYNEK